MKGFFCFKLNKPALAALCNLCIVSCIVLLFLFSSAAFFTKSYETAVSPYYKANAKTSSVCLMINVYEGADKVNAMLKILEEKDAKATFFLGGYWVKNNTNCAKMIAASKNCIGSHGYMHLDHKKLNYQSNLNEMSKAEAIIEEITERKITLFAPPSGAYGKDCLKAAEELGYSVIMWSKDTIDWRDHNTELIISRATKNPSGGDFILMHPTAETVRALPAIIDFYQDKDFSLLTVAEALSIS